MSNVPTNCYDALFSKDLWRNGELHNRAIRAGQCELIEAEDGEHDRIAAEVDGLVNMLESPIEQVALFHMLGRNYAPLRSDLPSYASAVHSLPEEWPEAFQVLIVPQVEVGRYRVDFMVHLKNGRRFAVECDGDQFHNDIKDGIRDSSLVRHNNIAVLRFTGSQIWESPLWTNDVRKMILMLEGRRHG